MSAAFHDFWENVDAYLLALRECSTVDQVLDLTEKHFPRATMPGDARAQGFFPGGGGDDTPLYPLLSVGWTQVRVDADYYWAIREPGGDGVLTYVEGDLYRGMQMVGGADGA